MASYSSELLFLIDIALGYAKDKAFYEAMEQVQAAQREYLIAEVAEKRARSRSIINAIFNIDIARIRFEAEYLRIEKDLSPDAKLHLQKILQDLRAQRQELVYKKKSLGRVQPALPPEEDSANGIRLESGDVLAVSRKAGLYQHFAVYIGNYRVIHYAAESGDFSGRITIHEASYDTFKGDSTFVYILDFPDKSGRPTRRFSNRPTEPSESLLFDLIREPDYHLYSPEETVERARSRLGEEKYSLPLNNCEHFAIWCKTGVHESHQVNAWLSRLATIAHRYI